VSVRFRFVIPDGSSSVLLVEDGSGWALPRATGDESEIVIDAVRSIGGVVGADVIVLRDLRIGPARPPEDATVYLTEPLSDPLAARGRWWTAEDPLDDVEPSDRAVVERWSAGEEPRSLQPWQRPGWFGAASAWIEASLPAVSDVRQYATWCVSCILRVTSPLGTSWFKATPASFAREPAVTSMLADLVPGRTPEVLALDADRGWMLLADLDGEPVDALAVDDRLEALLAVGELHRASVGSIDVLLDGGCVDRRPEVLATQIATLAADRTVPLPGDLDERLRSAVPRLVELCGELSTSPVPPTLVHGDLHAGNIMRTASRRYRVFDWSDACVADPFVDVVMFLMRLSEGTDVRARFREGYLDAWPGLTRAAAAAYADLAEPLAAMHHAVTYRALHDALGASEWWRFEGALPRWIRHALESPLVGG
jgi:Phosphotransferase enzyme family